MAALLHERLRHLLLEVTSLFVVVVAGVFQSAKDCTACCASWLAAARIAARCCTNGRSLLATDVICYHGK